MRALPASLLAALAACGGSPSTPPPDGTHADAAIDARLTDAPDVDAPDTNQCATPANLTRGLAWVRDHPMMIAGLSVAMGAPSSAAVDDYFDNFHATAVHTWENGLPTEIAGWGAPQRPDFRYVSWVHLDGTSVANHMLLGGVAPLPGRIGYQLGDEPQDQTSFDAIAAGAAAVKAADPDGLRIINLNDSDEANDLRTQAAQHADFDVLSYDHYTWGTSAHSGLASTRSAALAAGKPYWRYMKAFYYKDDSPEGAEADLRWDAFVGAVYGFTGYTWFVYSVEAGSQDLAPLLYTVGGDFDGTKTAQWAQAATINQQLARLGKTLVRLRSTDVRYVAKLINLSGLPAWSAGAGGEPYLTTVSGSSADVLVGTFRDDCDEPYVMVQNQAHPQGDYPNSSSSDKTITLAFDFASGGADVDPSALEALDLATGSVVDLALTSTGATTAKLDVTLPAGGVVLFKYKTGRAFASQ
jgi:hypothetical protein